MYKAIIDVSLKKGVLDPQGLAMKESLHSLKYSMVDSVRVGKKIEVVLDCEDREEAKRQVEAMCNIMLSNPVIEEFTFELEETTACGLPL